MCPVGFPIGYFKIFPDKLLSALTNVIKEALNNQTLPGSLELATITFLPKLDKDRQKSGSYRPLSLLNADYKIISKLHATRLDDTMPKMRHPDQAGFSKNRQWFDNVCRLFHILDSAQMTMELTPIISMDAESAFNRIKPTFLFQMLSGTNFGERSIHYIKNAL